MPDNRRFVVAGARVATGLVGIAIAVATVAAAATIPWPSASVSPVADQVTPVPTASQRVCPGPLLELAGDAGAATAASSIGPADITSADEDGRAPDERAIAVPDNTSGDSDGTPIVISVPAPADASTPPLVAGSQSQVAETETVSGLAVAACTDSSPGAWLVGGSTDVGRTTLVLLSNPTSVAATVDLVVYGDGGPVNAPGSTGILVQPGSQRIISLAGLAPSVIAPVVHVTARGGEISASLQHSILRGLEPGGIDLVGPTAEPAEDVTIAGVVIATAVPVDEAAGDSHGVVGDDHPALRLLVPGDTATDATVSAVGEGGVGGTSYSVHLEPGVPVDAPLDALEAGAYTIRVEADEPIVAAARTAVQGPEGRDIAWYTASPALGDQTVEFTTAPGPAPTLYAWNERTTDATVTVQPARGDAVKLVVPAQTAVSLVLAEGEAYLLGDAEGVVASIGYSSPSQLASFPVTPGGVLAEPIVVYTR